MNRELTTPAGGMYQEWDCLIDLLEQDKATELIYLNKIRQQSLKSWPLIVAGAR